MRHDEATVALNLWSADRFWARILEEADVVDGVPSYENALAAAEDALGEADVPNKAIPAEVVAELVESGVLNRCGEHIQIPSTLVHAFRQGRTTELSESLDPIALSVVERLAKKRDERLNHRLAVLWISQKQLVNIHGDFSRTSVAMPGLDEILEGSTFIREDRSGQPGYCIQLQGSERVGGVGAEIAAVLWESLYSQSRAGSVEEEDAVEADDVVDAADIFLFKEWLRRVVDLSSWHDAPNYMSDKARRCLLDLGVECLVDARDLGSFDHERKRIRYYIDHDAPVLLERIPVAPKDSDPWWKRTSWLDDVSRFHWSFSGDSLRDIHCTVASMVFQYDDSSGAYDKRFSRTRRIAREAWSRPGLLHCFTNSLVRWRPGSIAWILADPDLSELGLTLLLDHVQISRPIGWEAMVRDEQVVHEEEKRNELLRQAHHVFTAALSESRVSEPGRRTADQIASALVLFTPVQRRSAMLRHEYFREVTNRAFEDLGQALRDELFGRGGKSAGRAVVTAPELLRSVSRALERQRSLLDTHQPSMPTAYLGGLLYLLSIVQDAEADGNARLGDLKSSIFQRIFEEIGRAIHGRMPGDAEDEKQETTQLDSWYFEPEGIGDLQWQALSSGLVQSGRSELLFRPPSLPKGESSDEDEDGISGWRQGRPLQSWAIRLRIQLRILMAIVLQLPKGTQSDEIRKKVGGSLEEILAAAIAGIRTEGVYGDPFAWELDHPIGGQRAKPIAQLLPVAVERLNGELRESIAIRLVHERAPSDLALMVSTGIHEAATQQLLLQYVKTLNEYRQPAGLLRIEELENRIEIAFSLGLYDLVRTLLKLGERIPEEHPYRGAWLELVSQTELNLAIHEKDEHSLNRILGPVDGSQTIESSTSPIKRAIFEHYKVLQLLQHDPERAAHQLEVLTERNPKNVAYTVNLFSASVHYARHLSEDVSKRIDAEQVAAKALERWNAALSNLDPDGLLDAKDIVSRISIDALALASDKDKLRHYIDSLEDQRYELSVAGAIVDAFLRHMLVEEATAYIEKLKAFHRVKAPGEVPQIAELERRVKETVTDGSVGGASGRERPGEMQLSVDAVIADLSDAYNQILRSGPREQARIVGNLRSRELTSFVVEKVANAIELLRRKWHIIQKLRDEDQFTDFLMLQLKAQFLFLNWHVGDQQRLGKSTTSGMDAGSIDLLIEAAGGNLVVIIEAFRLGGKDGIKPPFEKHRTKPECYDHVGLPRFFYVLYYEGNNFEMGWAKYCQYAQVEDRSSEYTEADVLRIGVSGRHLASGGQMEIFHFFINMMQPVEPHDMHRHD